MSLHYLLDGYNVIKLSPRLAPKSLKEGRDGLVRLIELTRPQGSPRNKVTVVFDGRDDVFYEPVSSAVRVVFTRGETADDKIKKIVEASRNAKNIIVVTNDRPLGFAVRALGARVMGVQAFLEKAGGGTKPSGGPSQSPKEQKYISKTDEHRINTEFKKIWLKDELSE